MHMNHLENIQEGVLCLVFPKNKNECFKIIKTNLCKELTLKLRLEIEMETLTAQSIH